ncbi:CAP domain-containing protein [Actinomadura kijaniata]|uniref:CAP domain-containing protein n=1 Tax=Actinomadura kijaniata TaxID=46161 RepID=UPI003F1BF738
MRKDTSADGPDRPAASRRRRGVIVAASTGALFLTSLGAVGLMANDPEPGRQALSSAAAADPVPADPGADQERAADPRQPRLLNEAVGRSLVRQRARAADGDRGAPVVEARRSDRRHRWVFGSSALPPAARAEHAKPVTSLFLARRTGRGWDVALEGTAKFARHLRQVPASVVPPAEKRALTRYNSAKGSGDTGLRLPWKVGDSWVMGGGPHGNSGTSRPFNSLDFNGGDGRVLAAAAGRVYRFCSTDRSRGLIRVVHDNGYATEYYHMRDTVQAADGARVGQGEYLGLIGTDLPCGGSATGPHVHFALRQGGQPVAVDGRTIGGWTFHEGTAAYGGYAERAGQRVQPGRGRIRHEPAAGTPRPTPTGSPSPTATPPTGRPPAGSATGVVNSGWYRAVNLRGGPGLTYRILGHARTGDKVQVTCSARGDQVRAPGASSNVWFRLPRDRWVSAAYVYLDTSATVPACASAPRPTPTTSPEPSSPAPSGPTASTPPPPAGGSKQTTAEDEVVRLTNAERAKAGCSPLRIDERLRKAARGHAEDMRDRGYFSHNSPDGRTPWDRIRAAGYPAGAAENIAKGYPTPADVVKGWMNSSGHRANILNCGLKAIGAGAAYGSGGPWWVQNFGRE